MSPLLLCVATLVGVLTGCSFLGGNSQQRAATPVSRSSATATAKAQLAAANERLQGSLDQLRTSVALLPDRDALRFRVAAIEASLRRVEAGGVTARAAATANCCRDLVAQVEVVRRAVDAAHAGLASLEQSFAATGTLASDALTAAASTRVALESVYRAVVASLFSANPAYDARAVLAELAKAEPTVGNRKRRAAGAASAAGARAQAARRLAPIVAGLEKSCRSAQGAPAAVATLPSPTVFTPPPVVAPRTHPPARFPRFAPRRSGPPRERPKTRHRSAFSRPTPKPTPFRKEVGNEKSGTQPIPNNPPRIEPPQRPEPPEPPRIGPPEPPRINPPRIEPPQRPEAPDANTGGE